MRATREYRVKILHTTTLKNLYGKIIYLNEMKWISHNKNLIFYSTLILDTILLALKHSDYNRYIILNLPKLTINFVILLIAHFHYLYISVYNIA